MEIVEEVLLQVQVQLLEEMQDMEALAAEAVLEAVAEVVILIHQVLPDLEATAATVEREVMEAAVEQGVLEGGLLIALQGQEVQVLLAALEEEAVAAEILDLLRVVKE